MEDVVPSALQRLRAADIIRMAGLAVASLGQEYCRIGAVQATMRRGTQLLGIVDMSNFSNGTAVTATKNVEAIEQATSEQHRYAVDVEIQSSGLWLTHCTCNSAARSICQHGAALLYQWLAHPRAFATVPEQAPSKASPLKREEVVPSPGEQKAPVESVRQAGQTGHIAVVRGPTPTGNLIDILSQMGLSELRSI